MLDDFLSVETIHRNLCVGCNDDAVRIGDFLCSQHVFVSPEPSCLDFTKHPFCFRCFRFPWLPCKCGAIPVGQEVTARIFTSDFLCFHWLCKTLIYALFSLFIGSESIMARNSSGVLGVSKALVNSSSISIMVSLI